MMKSLWSVLAIGGLLMLAALASATTLLRDDHPDVYYVEKGDTLWDISGRFLQHPWQWPELWQGNPQIHNPHLIYPGDEIRLAWVDGKPRLTVRHGDAKRSRMPDGTVKLSPRVRPVKEEDAITAVPMSAIHSYLRQGLVVTRDQIEDAPYVVGGRDGRVIYGMGDTIYARDPDTKFEDLHKSYGVYRTGEEYVDPETHEVLGYEARQIGQGLVLDQDGDVATLAIQRSTEDVRIDDRLFSQPDRELRAVFYPHAPAEKTTGRIIRFFDRISSVARYDVVVINRGTREGLDPGTVLDVYEQGEKVRDRQRDEMIQLPRSRVGTLMLFRVFDKVSYGLVMESTRPISMDDIVESPKGSY